MKFWICSILFSILGTLSHAESHQVLIENMKFNPPQLQVRRGDKIVWINKDIVPHTATAEGIFDSGSIPPQGTYRYTFKSRKDISYFCRFHPLMHGTLQIKSP